MQLQQEVEVLHQVARGDGGGRGKGGGDEVEVKVEMQLQQEVEVLHQEITRWATPPLCRPVVLGLFYARFSLTVERFYR